MTYLIRSLSIAILLGLFSISGTAYAQLTSEEAVKAYTTTVHVNLDNSANVTETILYQTGNQARHGIYRDIYPYSSTGKAMSLSNISVTDQSGVAQQFVQQSGPGNTIRLKIGDPNVTFSGEKVYNISYRASYATAQLAGVDEIYWNATGNSWIIPIYEASATVILPPLVSAIQQACYYGPKGSASSCIFDATSSATGLYVFSSPKRLNPGEGLTVAVGFPKGIVTPYTQEELAVAPPSPNKSPTIRLDSQFFYSTTFVGTIVLLIAVFFLLLTYWFKNWRDPKGTGVIIAQYDVPDNLTPMEVSAIVYELVKPESISAELIYLATKGYIKIRQIDSKKLFFFKSTDYELILLKKIEEVENRADKLFLTELFYGVEIDDDDVKDVDIKTFTTLLQQKVLLKQENVPLEDVDLHLQAGSSIKLSSLVYSFYAKIPKIKNEVADTLLEKGYYRNLGRLRTVTSIDSVVAVIMLR
jgi:hypothetical protein